VHEYVYENVFEHEHEHEHEHAPLGVSGPSYSPDLLGKDPRVL
jgi:hypothetical protein